MRTNPGQILAILMLSHAYAISAAEGRFSALFHNQRQISGNDLRDIDLAERKGKLNGNQLFGASDPVRVVRDSSLNASDNAPWIEFTNGDILPGQVIKFVPFGNRDGLPDYFVVELAHDPQTIQTDTSHVRVRADNVKRIVGQTSNQRLFEPGFIALKDGRRIHSQSLRWTNAGLKALTPGGILSSDFFQFADVHVPERNLVDGVVSDAQWSFVFPDDLLMRIHTTSGAQLTIPRAMITSDVDRINRRRRHEVKNIEQIAVQPAWAFDAIPVPRECIVFRNYRRYDEIPLSLLPVAAQRSSAGLHHWPWQRNRGVKGSTLRSGEIAVDLGLGMHSYDELTFDLPPSAREFRGLVGLEDAVGNGGCVQCRLHAEGPTGRVLWDSGFLRGADGIKSIGPLSVEGVKQLTLVTDFGHEKRPPGADPYDIRDQVAWLLPTLKIDPAKLSPTDIALRIPKIDGWTISDEVSNQLKLKPVWNRNAGCWDMSMALAPNGKSSLKISRRLRVSARNACLPIHVRQGGGKRDRGHLVRVEVNGMPFDSTMNGDIKTERADRNPESRVWTLGKFIGQEIQIDVVVESLSNWSTGIIWDAVRPTPVITELGARDLPLVPDVPLLSVQPIKHNIKGEPTFQPGKLTNGQPLVVRSYAFHDGFGVPVGTELTYQLEPRWKRFVAVVGLADGWKGAGPYQIHLDGKLHWSSERQSFGRNDPAAQIDVPIPPGHRNITLTVLGSDSYGAWASSGFALR